MVVGMLGWRTHTIMSEADKDSEIQLMMIKLDPELYKDRESTALGVLGMPG